MVRAFFYSIVCSLYWIFVNFEIPNERWWYHSELFCTMDCLIFSPKHCHINWWNQGHEGGFFQFTWIRQCLSREFYVSERNALLNELNKLHLIVLNHTHQTGWCYWLLQLRTAPLWRIKRLHQQLLHQPYSCGIHRSHMLGWVVRSNQTFETYIRVEGSLPPVIQFV